MASPDSKIIALSKTKILLLAAGSLLFVLMGFWLLQMTNEQIQAQARFNDPTIIHVVAAISIAFSATCAIFAVIKLFDKRPGLVFSEQGIFDNASAVSAGLIPWSDITGFSILEIKQQKALIVKVINPEKYVEVGNPVRRFLNRANYQLCGSPVAIGSTALQIQFADLLRTSHEYFKKYGRQDA